MAELPWVAEAKKWLNTKETPGSANNPKIMQWAKLIGDDVVKDFYADSVPWCGLFAAYVFSAIGVTPVDKPLWALNWNKFGTKCTPCYGCVATFTRNGGGHVAILLGQDNTYFYCLGGNQSDSVNVTKIAKSRLSQTRWPPGMHNFKQEKLPRMSSTSIKVSTNEA